MKKFIKSYALAALLLGLSPTAALADNPINQEPAPSVGIQSDPRIEEPMMLGASSGAAALPSYCKSNNGILTACFNFYNAMNIPGITYNITASYYTTGVSGVCDSYTITPSSSIYLMSGYYSYSPGAVCKGTNKNIVVQVQGSEAATYFTTSTITIDTSNIPLGVPVLATYSIYAEPDPVDSSKYVLKYMRLT